MQATLMTPPNATWREVIEQAKQNVDVLKQPGVIRNLQNILQTNVSVCSSLGQPFITQMTLIYQDMLNVYRSASTPSMRMLPHLARPAVCAWQNLCMSIFPFPDRL